VLEEIGSVKLNTVPGVLLVAQTRPWCASTIQREIASPIAHARFLGGEERLEHPLHIFEPAALIADLDQHAIDPVAVERIDRTLGSLCSDSIASTPLRTRLTMTCCI